MQKNPTLRVAEAQRMSDVEIGSENGAANDVDRLMIRLVAVIDSLKSVFVFFFFLFLQSFVRGGGGSDAWPRKESATAS